MNPLTPALRAFRRGFPPAPGQPLPALFVLDSSMYGAAAVVASFAPASVLQLEGGAAHAGDPAVRATVEHAVQALRARTVVICAEERSAPDEGRARDRLLTGCRALLEDAVLGPLLRARNVAVEALWFDVVEGDVHRWDPEGRRFELLADAGLEALFGRIASRAA